MSTYLGFYATCRSPRGAFAPKNLFWIIAPKFLGKNFFNSKFCGPNVLTKMFWTQWLLSQNIVWPKLFMNSNIFRCKIFLNQKFVLARNFLFDLILFWAQYFFDPIFFYLTIFGHKPSGQMKLKKFGNQILIQNP